MPLQTQLFHDTIFDAIRADIAAIGGTKYVAHKLWPSKSIETATKLLDNALNSEQAQKLSVDELMMIKAMAKENNSCATIRYEAQQLGYEFDWISSEDELTQLLREIRDDHKRNESRYKRVESLLERMPAVRK